MTKIPPFTGKKLVKKLEKLGFMIVRQKGSHVILKHFDGRTTVVPIHQGQELDQSFIRKILKEVRVSIEDFLCA